MNKRDVQALLEEMPETIDPEDLIYRIYLLTKLEAAENDIRTGNVISHDELVRRSEEWLK